jgi:class 3 adenylate cyclase
MGAPQKSMPSGWLLIASWWATVLPVVGFMTWWFWLGAGHDQRREVGDLMLAFAGVVVALGAPPEIWLGWRWARILRGLQEKLDAGASPLDLPVADVRHILTVHFPVAYISFGHWAISALLWPLAVWVFAPSHLGVGVWQTVAAMFCAGYLSSVLVLYGANSITSRWMAPVFLRQGSLEHLRPVRMLRTYHHIILLVLSLGVVQPILVILLINNNPNATMAHTLALAAVMLALASVQVAGMVRQISGASGHLKDRMKEVRHGEMDTQAEVRSLDTFGELSSDFNRMLAGLRQRDLIRETFGRYVTQQVADEILAGRVELGGERRVATVLFSDIRGFTSMSESMTPEEVVDFLNDYLNLMVDCVVEHGGILDKFIGDAIMAVFGVPLGQGTQADDAKAAVRCALEMSKRLDALNRSREEKNEMPIEIGVGIHTGDLVAGNIGSPVRMEYTVIGDTVNVSSRLEGMTKTLGRRILLTAKTAALVEDELNVEELQAASVRGRQGEVRVFTPVL